LAAMLLSWSLPVMVSGTASPPKRLSTALVISSSTKRRISLCRLPSKMSSIRSLQQMLPPQAALAAITWHASLSSSSELRKQSDRFYNKIDNLCELSTCHRMILDELYLSY
jgi:hypothetical protein